MGVVMSAKDGVICLYILLLFTPLFPVLQAEPQVPSGPVGVLAQQRQHWQGAVEDVDEDRWREESERINQFRFDREGNLRATEDGLGAYEPIEDGPSAELQRLRMEGEKRQRATRLAWESRASEIQKKWGSVRECSPSVFVEYTKDNDAFGGVDYELGRLPWQRCLVADFSRPNPAGPLLYAKSSPSHFPP